MKRWMTISISGAAMIAAGIVAATLLTPAEAECSDPALCRPQQTRLTDHGFLRSLSLDIRGTVPTPAEYERMASASDPRAETEAMLDEWLTTDEFAAKSHWGHSTPEYALEVARQAVEVDDQLHRGRAGVATRDEDVEEPLLAVVDQGPVGVVAHRERQQTGSAYRERLEVRRGERGRTVIEDQRESTDARDRLRRGPDGATPRRRRPIPPPTQTKKKAE